MSTSENEGRGGGLSGESNSSSSPGSGEELLGISSDVDEEQGRAQLLGGSEYSSSAADWDGATELTNCQLFSLNSYMVGFSALWTCLYVVTLPAKVLEIVRSDNAAAGLDMGFAPSSSPSSPRPWTSNSNSSAWVQGQCAADTDKGKGTSLSLVLLAGAPAQVFLPPLIGYISDRTYTRYGSRRPFVFTGVLLSVVCLISLSFCNTLPILSFVWFLLQFSSNIGSNCFMAMLADVVPAEQFGKGSGIMGAFSCLGQFLGAAIGLMLKQIGFGGVYTMLILLHVLTSLPTLFLVRDGSVRKRPSGISTNSLHLQLNTGLDASRESDARSHNLSIANTALIAACAVVEPFRNGDFFWVFFTRFLFNMGQYTIQEFLQYYVCDLLDTSPFSPSEATSMLLMPMLFVALFTAYGGGVLSDRMGGQRKIFVYISGGIMAISSVVSIFNRSFVVEFLLCIFFGAAFGLFGSVDFALVCDVLPNEANRAKDMALWHIALVMPQFIAVPISGGILDAMNESHGPGPAYAVIFIISCFYFLLGAALVSKVKAAK